MLFGQEECAAPPQLRSLRPFDVRSVELAQENGDDLVMPIFTREVKRLCGAMDGVS